MDDLHTNLQAAMLFKEMSTLSLVDKTPTLCPRNYSSMKDEI